MGRDQRRLYSAGSRRQAHTFFALKLLDRAENEHVENRWRFLENWTELCGIEPSQISSICFTI